MTNTVRDINQCFWSSNRLPYLTIRTTFNSTQGYKAHSHSELSIGIIDQGSTLLTMPSGEVALEKGDIILIEPNLVHSCNPVDEMPRSYHMLYLDSDWCCGVLSKLYGDEISEFSCDKKLLSASNNETSLNELIFSLINQETDKIAAEVEHCLLHILNRYCSPKTNDRTDSELAERLKNRLLEDITSASSLDLISSELGRPKETLIRNFKKYFGITPKAFLNNCRVEQAKVLLKQGMSIVDVAAEVGFSDQSQLHKAFVNYTASTPRQYQQITSIFDNKS